MPINLSAPKRIIFLDYARVFAFLSVLIGHKFYIQLDTFISSFNTPHITQQYLANIFSSMFMGGGAGVVVFFMISGYIILHVLQKESPFEFLIKRFFRIYPLLIFAVIVQVLLTYFISHQKINLSTILVQMSLMGDFFNTPYALSGVEWTLRTEIMFYFFMFMLSFTTILRDKGYMLLLVLILITFSIQYISPFPTGNFIGYFTTYVPFLFLGSVIYMYEKKTINIVALLGFVTIVFYQYFEAIEKYSSPWLNTNFAITGFFVFLFLWLFQNKLEQLPDIINKLIIKLALLTYSVYVFHLFLWPYLAGFLEKIGLHSSIFILFSLLAWCTIMYLIIETPMNTIGKKLSKRFSRNVAIV